MGDSCDERRVGARPSRAAPVSRLLTSLLVVVAGLQAGAALAAVSSPHPGLTLVTHPSRGTLVVNLCAPGVGVRATMYAERKRTAKSFAQLVGLQAAINADFFDFPAATLVIGRAKGNWEWWPEGKAWIQEQERPYWQFGPGLAEGVAWGYDEPSPWADNIVGGHNIIIQDGQSTAPWVGDAPLLYGTHRRTGIGISQDRRTLYFTVVDSSINVETLVAYMMADAAEAGAPPIWYANNQDGGGSSQLWVQSVGWVISSTRQVANHLGVWATGSGDPLNCRPKYVGTYAGMSWPATSALGVEGVVELKHGETKTGWVKFTNNGDVPWQPGTTRLAPTPRDVPSPLASSSWIGPGRISGLSQPVQPGETATFQFDLTGNTPGQYTQYISMVEEGVTWFGDKPWGGGPGDEALAVTVSVSTEPVCEPVPESCNGQDDDCDGATDEGFGLGGGCAAGVGACAAAGTVVCVAGGTAGCNATPSPPGSESCNGQDDDCDGATDEDFALGSPCVVGAGVCAAAGSLVCLEDGAAGCSASPGGSAAELCDGLDNDCDGFTDEAFDVGAMCLSGVGACQSAGVVMCREDGSVGCSAAPGEPYAEVCNGEDDDCDGATDEAGVCDEPPVVVPVDEDDATMTDVAEADGATRAPDGIAAGPRAEVPVAPRGDPEAGLDAAVGPVISSSSSTGEAARRDVGSGGCSSGSADGRPGTTLPGGLVGLLVLLVLLARAAGQVDPARRGAPGGSSTPTPHGACLGSTPASC